MPHLPRTFTLYLRLVCAVAAFGAASACDSRTPTDPALTPVPLRGNESADAELGSISLTPTGSYSQFATIPEYAWALVRVSGKWIVESNPACAGQPPNWPCSSLAPYSGYDLEYPDAFRGPVRLATVSPTGSFDFLELRGSGGPDEGIGLTQREFSRDVLATPALINPSVQQFGNTGPSVASYIIDGSYMVTVTRIASPIRVTEGAAEADGSRTYTVEPLYGLKFINPLGSFDPPGAVRWFFVPGEDVDPVAPNSDPPWTINECRNLTTCRWTPPGAGRVQVSASVETRRARARSTGAPEPKLSLSCNMQSDSVTMQRGGSIDCRAQATPQASNPILWEFVADSFPYRNPAIGSTPHAGATWTGKMVLSGMITARTTIQGQPFSEQIHVRVTAREWRGKEFEHAAAEDSADAGEFTDRPDNVRQLGHIHNLAHWVLGQGYWEPILSGPNDLLGFLTKIPIRYQGRVHVNRLALRDSSAFWLAQLDSMPQIQPGQAIPCLRTDVLPVIPLIQKHEGVGLDAHSHAYLWVEEGKKVFGPAVEAIVGTSFEDLFNRSEAALIPMVGKADSASAWADSAVHAPSYCSFRYRYQGSTR